MMMGDGHASDLNFNKAQGGPSGISGPNTNGSNAASHTLPRIASANRNVEARDITPRSGNQSEGFNQGAAQTDVISGQQNQSLSLSKTSRHKTRDLADPNSQQLTTAAIIKPFSGSPPLGQRRTKTENDNLYLASLSSSCDSDWRLLNSSDAALSHQFASDNRTVSRGPRSQASTGRKPNRTCSKESWRAVKSRNQRSESTIFSEVNLTRPKMTNSKREDDEERKSNVENSTSSLEDRASDDHERQHQDESSSVPSRNPEDPWVRAPSSPQVESPAANPNPCRVRFVVGTNQLDEEAAAAVEPQSNPASLPAGPLRSSESQEELDRIARNRCSQTRSLSNFNERIRNDLDLLSRPSWCDARFALSRIDQGKAQGNRYALKLRALIHRFLFALGCIIQRNAFTVCFVGVLILAACCIGLQRVHMETNIEKLWVETGGQLEKEMQYRSSITQQSGSSTSSTSSSESESFSMQMLIQTGKDTSTVDAFKHHLEAALAATKVTVFKYNQTWRFDDVCYKQSVSLGTDNGNIFSTILDKLIPCFIITPLDCFWDASKLMGPEVALKTIPSLPDITWKNLDPMGLLNDISKHLESTSYYDDLKMYRDLMQQAGINKGYTDRWCLDPNDPECPTTAPNYESKTEPDVKKILEAGCAGFATKVMQWPLDLIVGGITYNKEGNITNTNGLQTIIQLMGADNMYEYHKNSYKIMGVNWNRAKSKDILYSWQRKFVDKMYKLNDKNQQKNNVQTLDAFTGATAEDILLKFSNISLIRVIGGYLLMIGYACLTLMRAKASTSQGAVGLFGVILVALSVAGGLGICSVIGISFNAASTQVLPFLMLGLGVDDMFLMAHHFGEIAVLSYIPFMHRTGECLKRVGVSVILTSIAILSGFLFSLIIPMPALRAFGLQAAVVTVFNLASVLIIFPAVLSLDLKRRRDNRLDLLVCFKSSATNEVVDLTQSRHSTRHACVHCAQPTCHQCRHGISTASGQHLGGQNTRYQQPAAATITVHNTIQAYSNESYVTVLGPSNSSTCFNTPTAPESRTRAPSPTREQPPRSPPPQYATHDVNSSTSPPQRPRVAFVNSNGNSVHQDSPRSERFYTPKSTRITPASSVRTLRSNGGSNPSTNLTTPMESVRSSTHSLVPKKRGKKSSFLCFGGKRSGTLYARLAVLPSLTLNQLGERYYAPFLTKTSVRVAVIIVFGALLGASIYGSTQIRDGLDFGDVLPRGTRERQAIVAQTTYFSFYNMYIVTKEFDYASEQENLYRLHDEVGNISYVMRQTDGTVTKFWLHYFRDYLQALQDSFDRDWANKNVNSTMWTLNASDKTVLAYKLLVQTGRIEDPTDAGRIGCFPVDGPCPRVNRVRLVSDNGLIREDAFYNYLSVWYSNDPLGYAASQAAIYPTPSTSVQRRDVNLIIPPSPGIKYAQMPFYLNNMRENEDFVYVIRNVRKICETMEKDTDVASYPSGYPFTFWQQYIDLRYWLFIALGSVIGAVFVVLSIVLFNPWAAAIMAVFLAMIATELLGFMGWAGVKLSAVPAVILVAAIGLGVEFTVHITFAYISSCGTRNERVARSIGHMLGPVVDGSISTLLGVIMLAGSEFDFIIKYFFQVLAMLILLGVINGLILLPVVLSLIGPPAEVIPLGGGARLKTPTPPPSPSCETECSCPSCRFRGSNTNQNNSVCHCVRCTETRRRCIRHEHVTSRDDPSMHRRHYHSSGAPIGRYGRRYDQGHGPCLSEGSGAFRRVRGGGGPQPQHPHSIPPIYEETEPDPNVIVGPRNDYVLYTTRRSPSVEQTSSNNHCESASRQYEFHPINPSNDGIASSHTNSSNTKGRTMAHESSTRDRPQHIATLSSSVTVNLHAPVLPKVVSFCDHNSSSSSSEYPVNQPRAGPLEYGSMPPRRFDISALNDSVACSETFDSKTGSREYQ